MPPDTEVSPTWNLDWFIHPRLRTDSEALRRSRLFVLVCFIGFIWGPLFAPIHYFIGKAPRTSLSLLVAGLATACAPLLLRWTGRLHLAANLVCVVLLAIVVEVTLARGGYPASALVWAIMIPLLALMFTGRLGATIWGIVILLVYAAFGLETALDVGLEVRMSSDQMVWIDLAGLLGFACLALSIIWIYESQLRRSLAAAESASQLKSDFLARMSHEIRTPMGGILGVTDLLLDSDLTKQQRDQTALVRRSANSLLRVMDDILDFVRAERGWYEIELRPFSLREELNSIVELFAPVANPRAELSCEVDVNVPPVLIGDAGRIRQVVINLVANAIKFTHRGEVAIHASASSNSNDQCRVRVEVRDTGMGIPDEHATHIFEPFAQVDQAASKRFGGVGLGLSICRQLVEQMGGRIDVDSQPGTGTTFSFSLPIRIATPTEHERWVHTVSNGRQAQEVPHTGAAWRQRQHILLAEDDETAQQVFLLMLKTLGYSTSVAACGADVLEQLEQTHCDLILIDCLMPDMDGREVAARIREMPAHAELPIVGITASPAAADQDSCLAAGMNDYLVKPITLTELATALARWVGQRPAIPAGDD